MKNLKLKIEGMACQGCATGIEQGLAKHGKLHQPRVDFGRAELSVGSELPAADVVALLEAMGYTAESLAD